MQGERIPSFVRVGALLALVLMLVLGACTKGGQFDPTEIFNSDACDSKKKLAGQREPVFPNGVPGTTTGVPQDLVKGYQPPPDQSDAYAAQTPAGAPPGAGPAAAGAASGSASGAAPNAATGTPAVTAEAKPKPKPKPKPKLASTPAAPGPAPSGPTRISIGSRTAAPPQDQGGAQGNWPSPAQASPPGQGNWPAPPATAPAQRTAQPNWPNPPGTTQ